jgi:exodeoxyribonuclease V gamma subunit
VHALQPFSRRYFERGGLLTYAGEWRSAHGADGAVVGDALDADPLPPFELDEDYRLTLGELASFLRQPARFFFRRRLGVTFTDLEVVGEDEEPFSLDALDRYFLEDTLLDDSGTPEAPGEVRQVLETRAARLAREGVLPIGLVGRQWQQQLVDDLVPVRCAWLAAGSRYPRQATKLVVSVDAGGVRIEDWIDRLRSNDDDTVWLLQMSSKVLDRKGEPRGDKLIGPWLRQLAAAAMGERVGGVLVARDASLTMAPLERGEALAQLETLVTLWRSNLDRPLPVACKTALAHFGGGDARETYDGGFEIDGEVTDPCLARLWPEFALLRAAGGWPLVAEALYGPLVAWLKDSVTVTRFDGEAP